jgi:hypothetical protein
VKGKIMKKRFFEKQQLIKNIKKSEAPLVLFAPLRDFYLIEETQKKPSREMKGENMQKSIVKKQQLIKKFKNMSKIFPSQGFLHYVRQTKKLKKVRTIFRFFHLFCM